MTQVEKREAWAEVLTEAFCQPSEFLKLTAMDPRYSAVVSMSSTVFYKGGDIPVEAARWLTSKNFDTIWGIC